MKQPNEDNNYITVRFSDVKEFLEELTPKETGGMGPGVDCIDGVVRVTKMFTRSQTYPIESVSVVAAILRYTPPTIQCIKLQRPVGEIMTHHDIGMNEKVMQKAESIQKEIEEFALRWHLEVRAGVFE